LREAAPPRREVVRQAKKEAQAREQMLVRGSRAGMRQEREKRWAPHQIAPNSISWWRVFRVD